MTNLTKEFKEREHDDISESINAWVWHSLTNDSTFDIVDIKYTSIFINHDEGIINFALVIFKTAMPSLYVGDLVVHQQN